MGFLWSVGNVQTTIGINVIWRIRIRSVTEVKINFFNSFGAKISESPVYNLEKGKHRIQQMLTEQGFHFVEIIIQNGDGIQVLKKKVLVVRR